MSDALGALLAPRSVAIVGASADPARTAGKPLGYLLKHGYQGEVAVVNPRYPELNGVPCYPSVAELPTTPDVGLVLLGGAGATEAVRQLAARGTPAAVVLSGGFAEIDAAGAARQAELAAAAGSMRLLGPNTIGLVNTSVRLALSASSALELPEVPAGAVSVVSQSGGMLGALLSRGVAAGVGFATLVATGNEADLDVCDVIDALLDDARTKVIALYLESVRRPREFRAAAARASARGVPLVVFKIGRSAAGAQSAASHTGALAGADRMYEALFRQTGAIRVAAMSELIDVSAALVAAKPLAGKRLAILTSTGGGGSLVAEAGGLLGFTTPPPDPPTVARLREVLVGEGATADRNPIDLTLANLRAETYRDTIAACVDSPLYDALVVVVGSSGLGDPRLAAEPVRQAALTSPKPVLVYVNPAAPHIVQYLNSVGVPAFASAEGCAAALAALRRRAAWADRPAVDRPMAAAAAPPELASRRGQLNEADSLALFAGAGIPVARQQVARTPADAAAFAATLSGPVVVKILSRDVGHKSDLGGVQVGVAPDQVAAVCRALQATVATRQPTARLEGWLIQEQVLGGTEFLLGVVRDPQLGLAVVLGAGGIATEVFDDSALRLLPLGPSEPAEMLGSLKARVLIEGFRGRPPGDVPALLQAITSFARLAETLGDRVQEAEINPLFVLPAGQGVRAADGLVILTP